MAISPALDIARRALLAHDTALAVAGNNIANVHTPGYTRQLPEYAEDAHVLTGQGVLVGSGVHVEVVRQVVDPLLERRRLAAEGDRGEQAARRDQLAGLAGIANDLTQPSLAGALDGFFDAADGLARNPAGLGEREVLLGRARGLAAELNRRSTALGDLQREVDDRVVTLADQADADLEHIAALNRSIAAAEVGGQSANELRDQRRTRLEDLASKLAVVTVENPDGQVQVAVAGGPVLVDGGAVVYDIVTRPGAAGLDGKVLHDLGLAAPGGGFLDVPVAFARGGLAGLVVVRDGALVTASANLDTLAGALRDAVNVIQTDPAARDLTGNGTTAAPLFAGSGAADLAVVLTDPHQVAAALSTEPGDNQNALRLADLRTTAPASVAPASASAIALGTATLGGFLAAELGRVGEEAAAASDAAAASERLAEQLEAQHEAVSGVNLHEELTNLLKTQRAFQAAARLLNVSNAVLDDLLHII